MPNPWSVALVALVSLGVSIVLAAVGHVLIIGTERLRRRLRYRAQRLRRLARVDKLTGVPSQRVWLADLREAMRSARHAERPLSIAVVVVDEFHSFVDAHGPRAGDRLLKGAVAAWSAHLRTVDLLARYDSNEFGVLLPNVSAADAIAVVGRLQLVMPVGQTVSAGVATWDATESCADLVARAVNALDVAKRGGRSRIIPSSSAGGSPEVAQA